MARGGFGFFLKKGEFFPNCLDEREEVKVKENIIDTETYNGIFKNRPPLKFPDRSLTCPGQFPDQNITTRTNLQIMRSQITSRQFRDFVKFWQDYLISGLSLR